LKEGDIVIAMTDMATETKILGVPTIVPSDSRNWLLNQRVGKLFNIDKSKVNIAFLKYILVSEPINEYYKKLGRGGLQINIGKQDILNAKIPLPPLPEQQRIVSILDEAFAAIAKAKANAEQNLKNAKELFESYLQGVFDPSTRSGQGKGDGWEIKTLGEVSKINYGYTEKASFDEVGPKFLRITDIQDNGVDWGTVPYCKCSDKDLPKYKLETGDIVFARTGATTGKSYLINNPPNAVFASYLIRLRMNSINEFIPEFISYFFQTKTYWDKINAGISGSAQGGFNATKLGELEFHFPKSKEAQQIIVRQLDALRAETQKLEAVYQQKIADLEELKKSILQKAFAGELKTSQEVV
jgi:type I restriction enzyme S subunit